LEVAEKGRLTLSGLKQILLATDLTAGSDVVAEAAVNLAAQLEANLVVLHVVTEEVLEKTRDSLPKEASYVDVILEQLARDLKEQIGRNSDQIPPACSFRVVEGDPSALILETLNKDNFDYAVIGVRNRSRVGKLILGSVTQDVLLGSMCPVVAVPT